MSFKSIINQRRAKEILAAQLTSGKVPHAYLFLGPDGIGRRRTAHELAKALNCHHQAATHDSGALPEPCDHCLSCQKIDAGAHPDVQLVDFAWQARLEGKEVEKQRSIKIDTIRAVLHEISMKPAEGRWKVFIIDPAEEITTDAANCLLKTLEEPPRWTMIILLAHHKENLPATIVSRAQVVPFSPLTEQDVAGWLILNAGCSDAEARTIAAVAEGSLAQALSLSKTAGGGAAPQLPRLLSPDTTIAELLRTSQEQAKNAAVFLDGLLAEAKHAFRAEPARGAAVVADILRTRTMLEKNVNPLMALDALFMRVHRRGN